MPKKLVSPDKVAAEHVRRVLEIAERESPREYWTPTLTQLRERSPLPFEPSMIGELLVIPKVMRLPRILLWQEYGELDPPQLNTLLSMHWQDVGWSGPGIKRVVRLFQDAGFVTDTPGTAPPSTDTTLYRGALIYNIRGLAWTRDEREAAWFAKRQALFDPEFAHTARVYSVTVPPRHVLGIFLGREEDEVVVNAPALRGGPSWGDGVPLSDPRFTDLTRASDPRPPE